MMKENIYTCEICGQKSKNKEAIQACEEKGIPIPLPFGTVFSLPKEPTMVFAIIKSITQHHYVSYATWACREAPRPDNCGGENYCGIESYSKICPPNTQIPSYQRMVAVLREAGIAPVDYEAQS